MPTNHWKTEPSTWHPNVPSLFHAAAFFLQNFYSFSPFDQSSLLKFSAAVRCCVVLCGAVWCCAVRCGAGLCSVVTSRLAEDQQALSGPLEKPRLAWKRGTSWRERMWSHFDSASPWRTNPSARFGSEQDIAACRRMLCTNHARVESEWKLGCLEALLIQGGPWREAVSTKECLISFNPNPPDFLKLLLLLKVPYSTEF